MAFTATKAAGEMRVKTAIDKGAFPKHFKSNLKVVFASRSLLVHRSTGLNESKRKATARRSEQLQKQAPENLIRFMIAYPPTVWEGQRIMSNRTFERLFSASEPEPDLLAAPFFITFLRELRSSDPSGHGSLEGLIGVLDRCEDDRTGTNIHVGPDKQSQSVETNAQIRMELQGNASRFQVFSLG
ncbi:hypothetical protein MBLNU13_g10378t1 [Cladosporium sp. NU13]